MNQPVKRCCIVGTAQSWKKTPWTDPSIRIMALNDCYSLGIPRADEWYDLHPFGGMYFRPKKKTVFKEGEIPKGVYVRPEGHLEWLKTQAATIPVWLHSDPPEGWPVNARRFPIEQVRAFLKARPDEDAYIASSPELMVAHAVLQGYTEIQIFGIHLATEQEYREQRPAFEWLLGKAQAMGIEIVLPAECPLLKHSHVYGYEPRPVRPDEAAQVTYAKATQAHHALMKQLVTWPRWKSKAAPLQELARLKATMHDAQQQARHALITAGAM